MIQHPNTKLIIIDTLKKIRDKETEQSLYDKDYDIVDGLKSFTEKHNICRLVVHHTRKMMAEDAFDAISGSNGLLGTASDLLTLLGGLNLQANTLTRRLNISVDRLINEYGISYKNSRTHSGKMIKLTLVKSEDLS